LLLTSACRRCCGCIAALQASGVLVVPWRHRSGCELQQA
jgi:hypothetical protein